MLYIKARVPEVRVTKNMFLEEPPIDWAYCVSNFRSAWETYICCIIKSLLAELCCSNSGIGLP